MTKEELEKKLKISKNTGIHCPTLELAKQVLNIFHKLGLKWYDEVCYTKRTNWENSYKENTIYHPFEGYFSSLKYAQQNNYKIISAEEFITLHKEEFDLENYIPKGQLDGFPKEIIAKMLEYQEKQSNPRDITVFETIRVVGRSDKGFEWNETQEDWDFWHEVIDEKNFNLFFEKYPKQDNQDNSQEFKIGDEVFDIILGQKGKVHQISTNDNSISPICVSFNGGKKTYALDGMHHMGDKHPRLLHYRDDYDYNVINFNNLPKRQEPKRWRANKGSCYWVIENFSVYKFKENNTDIDDAYNNLGNYFQTEEEAQEVADKLKEYFKQLIQEEHGQ